MYIQFEQHLLILNYKKLLSKLILIVDLEEGSRLLLLECQSSIFMLGLCDFFGLIFLFC